MEDRFVADGDVELFKPEPNCFFLVQAEADTVSFYCIDFTNTHKYHGKGKPMYCCSSTGGDITPEGDLWFGVANTCPSPNRDYWGKAIRRNKGWQILLKKSK